MHDTLERDKYRDDMINQLNAGKSLIWTGQFTAAGVYADSVEKQLTTNGFVNDPLVVDALRNYRNKIRSQICRDAKEAFEILVLRVQNEIDRKHFIRSEVLLDSALSIATSAPLCKINVNDVKDTLNRYSAAIRYQKNSIEIRNSIRNRRYDEVLGEYNALRSFYYKNDVVHLGLDMFPLYDIIEASQDPLFTGHAIVFYSNRDSLSEAFRYVNLLRSQGYPRRNAKDMLEILGKKMAAEDFIKYPLKDPFLLLEEYTGDDGWFRKFRVCYLKEWEKRLRIKKIIIQGNGEK